MSIDDLSELLALAERATAGEWLWPSQWNGEYAVGVVDEEGLAKTLMTGNSNYQPECQRNMAYIAAANPEVITRLCTELRALRAECAEGREVIEHYYRMSETDYSVAATHLQKYGGKT